MTYTSARLSRRRLTDRQAVLKEKLITFLLDREWFAISVVAAFRIVSIGDLTGGPRGSKVVFYAGHQVTLINIDRILFQRPLTRKLTPHALLLLGNPQTALQGILLDSPPILRNIARDSFIPLLQGTDRGITCLHSRTLIKETIPLYILDLEKLLAIST